MTEKGIFGNKNTPSRRPGVMMILRYKSYGFCGFSVCWHINSVNRRFASTIPICLLMLLDRADSGAKNCSRTISISQEQMLRAQIYKRLIAACNPIALLAQVWHQKSIWGCLTADKSATAERRCRSMNYKHFKHFRSLIVSKMLIVQMNGYSFFFSADRQRTGNIHGSLYV